MITVISPPGCYGTYISRCLYHYTNLGFVPGWTMSFDSTGSSHDFRKVKQNAASKISNQHRDLWSEMSFDQHQTVIAYADMAHLLDYYDNQFVKQEASDLVRHLLMSLSRFEIRKKLFEQWHYRGPIREAPRWIMREFLSLWLTHSWQSGYNIATYIKVPHAVEFCCEDLFKADWPAMLGAMCNTLNLDLLETAENIQHNHDKFLECQTFHGIQHRCEQFVQATINGAETIRNPCITIFDEAFVQNRLRNLGWEIQCDGLEILPYDSVELNRIIHKT